jgi:minor extracellular protease Epr
MNKAVRFISSLLLALIILLSFSGYSLARSNTIIKVIVGLPGPASTAGERMIVSWGGKIDQRFHLISAFTAEVPDIFLPVLRSLKEFSYVEPDSQVIALEQVTPWGIQAVKAPAVQSYNQGQGVKVAVIDTGIDLTHPDLRVSGNVTFVSATADGNDDNGHGTHVAGVVGALNNQTGVVGVAPEAQLYAVKVLNSAGSGSWSSVINGLQWAVDNHMDIATMSLGSTSGSMAVKLACDTAYESGLLILAAAGNSGHSGSTADNVLYPAKYDSVIAVGATDSSSQRAGFSSTGPAVELAAPGVNIYSTYKNHGYSTLSGTSMATPHAAGVAALVFASSIKDANKNGRINDEVRLRLQQTAHDLGQTGRDPEFGFGLVDAGKAAPPPVNNPPVAEAGADRTVFAGTSVILDGSLSYDPDGDPITYSWEQKAGVPLVLSGASGEHPSFTPVVTGNYTFQLIVNDGQLSSTPDTVTIAVRSANTPPATPEIAITPANPVTSDDLICLITRPSTDTDGDPVTYGYTWYKNNVRQTSLTTNTVAASFTTKGQTWRCEVTPNDGFENGVPASAQVTIGNTAPVADAGADQHVGVNKLVTLDASRSTDADGDILSYSWTQTGGPGITLVGVNSIKATFTPSITGNYSFRLAVNDGNAFSLDEVVISVSPEAVFNMHIENVSMILMQRYGGYRTYAIATVSVFDGNGSPVADVSVKGHWTGAMKSNATGTTGDDGNLSLTSPNLPYPARGSTFIFTVDSLSRRGWTYDYAFNKTSSGSIAVP